MDLCPETGVAQQADTQAQFRFFDLPGELRSKVYEELLTIQPHRRTPASQCCSPAILATSKEVRKEADGYLNSTDPAEVSIILRSFEYAWAAGTKVLYSTHVKFKGVMISRQQEAFGDQDISWPKLLSPVSSVTLKIHVQRRPFSYTKSAGSSGERHLTRTLCSLYRFFADSKIPELQVETSSSITAKLDKRLQSSLSPLCTLVGKAETSFLKLESLSDPFRGSIRKEAAAWQHFHAVMDEVDLALE